MLLRLRTNQLPAAHRRALRATPLDTRQPGALELGSPQLPNASRRPFLRLRGCSERGQASVEYALVLLGAALVATLLIGWATSTNLLNQLFDSVLNLIRGKATA